MRFLVGGMMVGFLLAGLSIVAMSVRELFAKLARRHRFERVIGTVEGVKSKMLLATGRSPMKPTRMNFPIIHFQTRSGEPVTFTSETGDAGETSRYERGQRLGVCYDPEGKFPPMLDSWFGIWLPSLMGILGGAVFVFGAFLIYFAFGDKILGR